MRGKKYLPNPISVLLCEEQDPQSMDDTLPLKDTSFHHGSTVPRVKGVAGCPFMCWAALMDDAHCDMRLLSVALVVK